MNNFYLLGTDGEEYEVIVLIDVRTKLPLEGHPFALVAKKLLQASTLSTNDLLSLSEPRAQGLREAVYKQIDENPDFLGSLRQVPWNPVS
jgi:hypothetical protein